jgi:hypothetical protein
MMGGLVRVEGARTSFDIGRGAGGLGYALCYRFHDEPFALYPSITPHVREVGGSLATIAVQG